MAKSATGCAIGLVVLALVFGLVWLETVAFQWLLAQFGIGIGFWKAMLMLFVIDFIFGSMVRVRVASK